MSARPSPSVTTPSKLLAVRYELHSSVRRHYLQLPVYTRTNSPPLNILITSLLELTVIQSWFSTWSLLDTVMTQLSISIINNIILSLSIGLGSGILAFTLQLPLLHYVE